ncbi:MAG: hypothetical protein AAF664_16480, partial [Planctomycetota bacterium]
SASYKFVENCEYRLFQRPDDAIHRGLDKQTEWDLSRPGNFISNFQPLTLEEANNIVHDAIDFDGFTMPMKNLMKRAASEDFGYVVCSSSPRINDDGRVTSNPRYLQDRPDMVFSRDTYVAKRGMQLFRGLGSEDPVHAPVGAILSGRRNNAPDREAGIRALAVYSPLHYQELPELVMDYVCSLTGKSPSTTGAGSEGALTKAPFNALMPSVDLNSMVVSMILTGLGGFSTPAGHIGPKFEVGHDISLLIPEVWCRMSPEERDPANLIAEGMLEKLDDYEREGTLIPASRLGFRITGKFVRRYMSRVFDNASKVFPDEILKPELQDQESFDDGILHIAEAQTRVAKQYFEDGGYELACPPLQAILSILHTGSYDGHDINSPEVRSLFDREQMLASDWYRRRLATKRSKDLGHWQAFVTCLEEKSAAAHEDDEFDYESRLAYAKKMLERVRADDYESSLVGTIGADPMGVGIDDPSMIDKLAAAAGH